MKSFNLVFVSLVVLFTSCASPRSEVVITIRDTQITVETAVTPDERATGLMYREDLDDGFGMLFVFEEPRMQSFWMKNTVIPLSIAYADADGRILEIYDMEPESLAPVRSRYPAKFALEVPQGFFLRADIRIGDRMDLTRLHDE